MAFGLQIQNNSGDVVVDADYQNHVIAESATVASPALGVNTVTFSGSYDIGRQPMLFGRCTGDWIGFYQWTFSGSNVTGFQYYAKAGGSSFDWKLLVTPTSASSDAFGMRVYDGSSNLVFDAGLNYLNMIDAVSVSMTSFATGSITHASGTTPFYCLSSGAAFGAKQTSGAPASTYFFAGYKAVDSTHVNRDWIAVFTNVGLINIPPRPDPATLLVMDATAPSASTAEGINLWDASGNVQLTMTSKLTRFMYTTLATAGSSSNASVSGLDPTKCVGFALMRAPGFGKVPHDVTLTSGNVAWAPPASGTSADSDVYVIQYK